MNLFLGVIPGAKENFVGGKHRAYRRFWVKGTGKGIKKGGGAWWHAALSSVSRVVRNGPMLGLHGVKNVFAARASLRKKIL